jgi:hypothetical protein
VAANPAADKYGGLPIRVAEPSKFFRVKKTGKRWTFVTPAGNVFFLRGVYNVDVRGGADDRGVDYSAVVAQKYGSDRWSNWAPQTLKRLQAWGFNSTAEYGSLYVTPTHTYGGWTATSGKQPVPLPFTPLMNAALYAKTNYGGYASGPVKDLVQPTKSSVYTGYRAGSPDIWDPNYKQWLAGALQHDFAVQEWLTGPNNDYLIGLVIDETDSLQGFGPGADFKTINAGQANGGNEQPHLSWLILITPPVQTGFADPVVYSKRELGSFLASRYGNNIAALNAAWGASYSSFGSAGGWGVGGGVLDEDGTHSWVCRDFLNLAGCSAGMRQDLDDFLLQHARKYFSDVKSVVNTYAPGRLYLGTTYIGGWGGPARRQVLQAAGENVDVLMTSGIPPGTADDQARIDFMAQYLGDKPWVSWEGMLANPDSYLFAYPIPWNMEAASATQAARGQLYTQRVNRLLNARTPAGNYPVVGFKFWELVDNWGEKSNWGLITRRDNAYDGKEARTGVQPCSPETTPSGYNCGGEERNYGDFLTAVTAANIGTYVNAPSGGPGPAKLPTNTTLVSSLNPATAGQLVTLTATVSSTSGAPTGNVQFNDGATLLGTAPMTTGKASISLASLGAGTHTMTAVYGGDANYLASSSAALSEIINAVPPPPPASSAIRVNAGGPAYTDPSGQVWSSDSGVPGSFAYSFTYSAPGAIANTSLGPLYQDIRSGPMTYSFTVPNGVYTVNLKFAEIWFTAAGKRLFNVAINGSPVLSNFDIFASAGGPRAAIDKQFSIPVSNGAISIQFTAVLDQPSVNAIEIVPQSVVSVALNPSTVTLPASQTQQFTATVTGSSNTAVTWSLSPAVGQISATGLYTAPASVASAQSVTVIATSAADSSKTGKATVSLQPAGANGSAPIRVNAGGPSVTDQSGAVWVTDQGLSGNFVYSFNYSAPGSIANTAVPALYTDFRSGPMTYVFTVPNGTRTVTLKFAEIWYTASGKRSFNVSINGQAVLTNFDIVAAAGGARTAVDKQFSVVVSGGSITIQFTPVVDQPAINAIQIN